MFSTIVKKEMLDHILSVRFASLLFLCILLVPFSMYVSYQKYLVKYNAYGELRNAYERDEGKAYDGRTNPDHFRILRPPSPLSVLVNGLEDSLPIYMSVDKNGIRLGPSAMAEKSVVALFGDIDFLFLVKVIFSLLAVLFAFDLVVGEKETGTLRAMLAHALPRGSLIAGKYLSGYLILVVPFILSVGVGLLLISFTGFPLFSKDILLRVLFMCLVSLLYISVFFSLGLLISSCFHRSKTALLVLLLLWVFLIFILPKTGYIAAEILRPVQSDQTIYARKRFVREDIEQEKSAKLRILYKSILGSPNSYGGDKSWYERYKNVYLKERNALAKQYQQRLVREMKKVDDEHHRKKRGQEQLGLYLSRISPSSCFSYVMSGLASTGELEKRFYVSAAERYREDMNREVFSKIWWDTIPGGVGYSGKDEDAPSSDEYPRPSLRTPGLSESLHASLLDILLLALFNILFSISSYAAFLRYDVR